jgi:hypothetical protein
MLLCDLRGVLKMVNRVMNDKGDFVVAVGQKGSKERAACEHPALIERYRLRYYESNVYLSQPYCFGEADDDLKRQDGIKCAVERRAILANTNIT